MGPCPTQLSRTTSVRWTLCATGQTGWPGCSSVLDVCENMAIRHWRGGCYSILAEIQAGIALETAQAVKCYTSRLLRFVLSWNSCKGVGERVKMTGDHRLWEACYKAKWALVSHTQLCFTLKVYNFQGVSDQETELKYFHVDEPYQSKRKTVTRTYYKCVSWLLFQQEHLQKIRPKTRL